MEVDTTTNTTDGGIYVDKVPQRVCEIVADLVAEDVDFTVNGADYTGSCGAENKMVFYYGAIDDALGNGNEPCNGPLVDGVCQPCEDGKKWDVSIGECLCISSTQFLFPYTGSCEECPCNTIASADGKSCACPEGMKFYPNFRVCYDGSHPDVSTNTICALGFIYTPGATCMHCPPDSTPVCGNCQCPDGSMVTLNKWEVTPVIKSSAPLKRGCFFLIHFSMHSI